MMMLRYSYPSTVSTINFWVYSDRFILVWENLWAVCSNKYICVSHSYKRRIQGKLDLGVQFKIKPNFLKSQASRRILKTFNIGHRWPLEDVLPDRQMRERPDNFWWNLLEGIVYVTMPEKRMEVSRGLVKAIYFVLPFEGPDGKIMVQLPVL